MSTAEEIRAQQAAERAARKVEATRLANEIEQVFDDVDRALAADDPIAAARIALRALKAFFQQYRKTEGI